MERAQDLNPSVPPQPDVTSATNFSEQAVAPAAPEATQAPAQPESPANQSSQNSLPTQDDYSSGFPRMMKEEILLQWTAPSRPFKKHNRQFYTTVGVIAGLISLILFFAGQVLPVAVVVAVVFLTYVMYSIPPGEIIYKFTTYGIRIEEELYYWEEMGRFWIKEKFEKPVLYIEVSRFPNRLTIMLGDITKDEMEAILSEVLLNQEPPPTTYEKAAKWLHEKIPLDIDG
jgi:hypothetical protein